MHLVWSQVCEYREELKRQEEVQIRLFEANKSLKQSYQDLKKQIKEKYSDDQPEPRQNDDPEAALREYAKLTVETPHLDDKMLNEMKRTLDQVLSSRHNES